MNLKWEITAYQEFGDICAIQTEHICYESVGMYARIYR